MEYIETQSTSTDKQSTKKAESLSILISIDIRGIVDWNMLIFICEDPIKILIIEAATPNKAATMHIIFDTRLHNLCSFIKTRAAVAAIK